LGWRQGTARANRDQNKVAEKKKSNPHVVGLATPFKRRPQGMSDEVAKSADSVVWPERERGQTQLNQKQSSLIANYI
jgi:hypothetical protein